MSFDYESYTDITDGADVTDVTDDTDDIAARFGIAPDGQTFYQQTGKKPRKTKKTAQQITAELIETPLALEGSFHITYKPARYQAI